MCASPVGDPRHVPVPLRPAPSRSVPLRPAPWRSVSPPSAAPARWRSACQEDRGLLVAGSRGVSWVSMATTRSRPPGRRSTTSTPQVTAPRKETMEVDISWLEAETPRGEEATPPRRSSRPPARRPPPLADAALRHPTLEVAPEWLQVDDAPATDVDEARTSAPRRGASAAPGDVAADGALRRARPPWQPPTLPPPPAAVARRPARGGAAPIPREDAPSEPPPPKRRPPAR